MTLAPNPADDQTLLSFDTESLGQAVIQLVDNMGRIVFRDQVNLANTNQYLLLTGEYPAGLYQVSLLVDNKIQTIELSINH